MGPQALSSKRETSPDSQPGSAGEAHRSWPSEATLQRTRSGRGKKIWIIGGLAVALVGGGLYAGTKMLKLKAKGEAASIAAAVDKKGGKTSNNLTVTTQKPLEANVVRTLLVTGSLAAWDELPIGTQTSGLAIKDVLVEEGDRVQAGQLLVRFDDSLLRADLLSREAALRETQALAAEAEANIRRAEELARTGAISNRDLDSRRSAALTTKARVGVAEAAREQAAARLRQTELRSPVNGTIARRNARIGAVMSAGGMELFRIIRDDRVELAAEVPEIDLRSIETGQKAILSAVSVKDGKPYEGRVRLVSPVIDTRTRIGSVRIEVPSTPDLKPGMFVSALVETKTFKALTVPEAAIIYRDARAIVIVVEPTPNEKGYHQVHERIVTPGTRQGDRIAILSGLSADEQVVLSGAGYLKESDQVKINNEPVGGAVRPLPSVP
jgi:HlyD family secretion protein